MIAPCRTLVLAVPLLFSSCTTVADRDDPTPPEVTLSYRLNDDLWAEVPAEGLEIAMDLDDTLHLWGQAEDEGGVFMCAVQGSGTVGCRRSFSLTNEPVEYLSEVYAAEGTESGDATYAELSAVLSLTRDDLTCSEGELERASLAFDAYALNFNETPGAGLANSAELAVEIE